MREGGYEAEEIKNYNEKLYSNKSLETHTQQNKIDNKVIIKNDTTNL